MQKQKLISVIIPIYNCEKYVECCVKSVCHQTYKNLEIILVNDGSTDDSLNICLELERVDDRIRVISSENHGVSHARNIGLKHCNGEYIGFVDADDEILPTMYEIMVKRIEASGNADMACCTDLYLSESGKELSRTYVKDETLESKQILQYFFRLKIPGGVCNKLFSRKLIADNSIFFDESISMNEDLLFVCEVGGYAKYCTMINIPLYIYYEHLSSVTHIVESQYNPNKISFVRAAEEMKKKMSNIDDETLKMWNIYCCHKLIDAIGYLKKYKYNSDAKNLMHQYKRKIRPIIWRLWFSRDFSIKYKIVSVLRVMF